VKVVKGRQSLGDSVGQGKESLLREKERLLHALGESLENLKEEVDYVLLPVAQNLESRSSQLYGDLEEMLRSLRQKVPGNARFVSVPLDATSKALRQRMTELGLLFTRDLGAIRRAYALAFAGT